MIFIEQTGKLPDCIIACVGGGSNAIGLFSGFLEDEDVKIYGVEPLGKGQKSGDNAASMTYGKDGIIHGFKCKVLQDSNGNPVSITYTKDNATVRTDTFVWTTNSVTETRTLANGKYITIVTNLETLAQTISEVQEVA